MTHPDLAAIEGARMKPKPDLARFVEAVTGTPLPPHLVPIVDAIAPRPKPTGNRKARRAHLQPLEFRAVVIVDDPGAVSARKPKETL